MRRGTPPAAAGLALALLLAGAGCAELTEAPPPPPPGALVPGVADPLRLALDEAARAFEDRGAALEGRPAEAAAAMARLEYVADALPADPRYRRLAEGTGRELALARSELRDALGVAEAASPRQVIDALLLAATRLRAGDAAGAARALPAPTFRPGGSASVARLAELGPLPQASFATTVAREALARADASVGGISTQAVESSAGIGTFTTRFEGELSTGY